MSFQQKNDPHDDSAMGVIKKGRVVILGFIWCHPVLYGVAEGNIWGFIIRLVSCCDIKIAYKVAYKKVFHNGWILRINTIF